MRTIFVGILCLLIGFELAQRVQMARVETYTSYQPSDMADTTYDYGSSYSYDSYDYSYPCTDPIVLPNNQGLCKEDQAIGTLVEQMRRANTRFVDPGQSVLFWRYTRS